MLTPSPRRTDKGDENSGRRVEVSAKNTIFRGKTHVESRRDASNHPTTGSFDPTDDFYRQNPLSALFTKRVVRNAG